MTATVALPQETDHHPGEGPLTRCGLALAFGLPVVRRHLKTGDMSVVHNNARTTRQGGVTGAGFRPGVSGNPGGWPRGLARRVRELAWRARLLPWWPAFVILAGPIAAQAIPGGLGLLVWAGTLLLGYVLRTLPAEPTVTP